MKKFLILLLILTSSATSFASQQPQDQASKIKMLHIFIKADTREVRFENLWAYRRDKVGTNWHVNIQIPESAALEQQKDPNNEQISQVVSKDLKADSLIDSVSFTYFIANDKGRCSANFKADYDIDSMVVYVSGPETTLKSDLLKLSPFQTLRSRYSGVYVAKYIPAGRSVNIELSSLPAAEDMFVEYASIMTLVLIVLTALLTLIVSKLKMKNKEQQK